MGTRIWNNLVQPSSVCMRGCALVCDGICGCASGSLHHPSPALSCSVVHNPPRPLPPLRLPSCVVPPTRRTHCLFYPVFLHRTHFTPVIFVCTHTLLLATYRSILDWIGFCLSSLPSVCVTSGPHNQKETLFTNSHWVGAMGSSTFPQKRSFFQGLSFGLLFQP